MTETNSDTGRNVPARPNRAITPAEYEALSNDLVVLSGADYGYADRLAPRAIAQVIELLKRAGYEHTYLACCDLYRASAELWPAGIATDGQTMLLESGQ
jgi:hypothetical protein